MKNPIFRAPMLMLFSVALLHAAAPADSVTRKQPNIIFIVADDMGYADCGVQGSKEIPTPNLDALAASGIRFTDGYVTGPVCSPSRAALMTGRYQLRDGVADWLPAKSTTGLEPDVPTVADYLHKAGYRTALVGKWHLGEGESYHPMKRGFDEFFGFLGGQRSYFPDKPSKMQTSRYSQLVRGTEPVVETEYMTHAFAREAVDFISRQQQSGQPFFLYLAFNAVHTPMEATQDDLKRFASIQNENRRAYVAMLSAMDSGIGRVLKSVRDGGIEDSTLICFISDNGGPITRNAPNGSANTPLRGGKGETWEGGIRVPFFMKWSGHLKPGTVYSQPVIQMDLTATVLALAGSKSDPKWPIDGVDLMPFLTGKPGPPHPTLCWKYGQQRAIRQGKWKLVYATPNQDTKEPVQALYDLETDISETHDQSAEQPELVKQLNADWVAWQKSVEGDKPAAPTQRKDGDESH